MSSRHLSNRRRTLPLVGTAAVLLGLLGPAGVSARADDVPVPSSCKVHPTKVVNPGCAPALVEEVTGYDITYPDLSPDITDVMVWRRLFFNPETERIEFGPPELAFDTQARNVGTVPIDLLTDDIRDPANSTVSQCVAWTTNYVCRERRQVGGFSWHDEHSHYHFNDFGKYEFRRTLADGTIDYSTAGLLGVSDKVSFCLMDSERLRDDAFPMGRYTNCDSINQGVSPGWTDTYGAGLPGQQFPLTGVPDGRYALTVDMDTANHVYETDEVHNRVEVIVEFTTNPDTATIVSHRWP